MQWFKDLKVGIKLIAAFLVVSAITAAVGYVGIKNMGEINAQADSLYELELMGLSLIKEANINLIYSARAARAALTAASEEERTYQIN